MPTRGQDTQELLHRLLHSGRFEGFPSNPYHLDTVLAVAAGSLDRRRPYAEWEINEALAEWLASVRADLDHVTLEPRHADTGSGPRTLEYANSQARGNRPPDAERIQAPALAAGAHPERERQTARPRHPDDEGPGYAGAIPASSGSRS